MNTKILIETLIEIPDKQLLEQLTEQIKKNKSLIISDVRRFFHMLSCLFSGTDRNIKIMAISLYKYTFQIMIGTEIQISWNQVSQSLIRMLGEEDGELRKKSKYLILDIIQVTNNASSILQKVFYLGLHDESMLVVISSIKLIQKILQEYPTLLNNKANIKIVKMIMEKIIFMSMNSKHIDIQKTSKQFLDHLFYLKIQKLDQVLTLMNEMCLQKLQKLWAFNKQKMLRKQQQREQQETLQIPLIKYEHLPLINGKFFGVYQPYVLKNIFNPQVPSAKVMAIKHFHEQYINNQQQLLKYSNVIYKVLLKFLHEAHYDMLQILKKLLELPGISNMINVSILPSLLIPQLNTDNVKYRKDLREIVKVLHYLIPKQCIKMYQKEVETPNIGWIQMHELLQLLQHWIDNNVQNSYPPTLNFLLKHLCLCLQSKTPKIKDKGLQLLLIILDRYAGYRQNLQDHFSQKKIAQLQDLMEDRKTKGKKTYKIKQTQQIFMREYKEERERYLNHSKFLQNE